MKHRCDCRTWLLILICVILALSTVTACGTSATPASFETTAASETSTTTTRTVTPTTTPAPTPTPTPLPESYNTLTGTYTLEPDRAGRRPVAIMLNNIAAALPQYGIGEADLIYEMVVEAGITRILALYADAAAVPQVSSIRSARHSYIDLAAGHDALMVHFGASPIGWEYMAELGISSLDWLYYSAGYWRDPVLAAERGAVHSVTTDGDHILRAIEGKGLRDTLNPDILPAFVFRTPDESVPAKGDPCDYFSVKFSVANLSPLAEFEYESDTGTYAKKQFGDWHVDGHTGDPIHVTNVFVLFTEIYPLDHKRVAARFEAGGNGYYLSGGRIQSIQWVKPNLYEPIQVMELDGNPLSVNAGRSYVSLVTHLQEDNVTIR